MNLRTIAFSGVAGLTGLGLVGAGAHAAFTTATSSSQTITAGTAAAVTWSPDAQNGCTDQAIAQANPSTCSTVTLPLEVVGSTFDTTAYPIYVTNNGNISVTVTSLGVSDTNYSGLGQDLGMCATGAALGAYQFNNAISAFAPNPYSGFTGATLATSGDTAEYTADFFAGETSSVCGAGPTVPALTNAQEGASDTITLTVGISG